MVSFLPNLKRLKTIWGWMTAAARARKKVCWLATGLPGIIHKLKEKYGCI
jgi:hypothetical protein